jgi:hypothetical protein
VLTYRGQRLDVRLKKGQSKIGVWTKDKLQWR